mmetsp:Transcript_90261/g.244664  ORF Transcript_90261/g.244664 Transcript_90261/m.244664 type:complete len:423 (+) Transcript_90261:246-1514(+)
MPNEKRTYYIDRAPVRGACARVARRPRAGTARAPAPPSHHDGRARRCVHAVQVWEGHAVADAAHILEGLDLEEALLAETVVPTVLDRPVPQAAARVRAVAHGQDRVVDVLGAIFADRRGIDPPAVVPEVAGHLVRDGYRTGGGEVVLQTVLVADGDVDRAPWHLDADARGGGPEAAPGAVGGGVAEGAHAVLGRVRVVEFGREASRSAHILEGMGGQAAVAAVVVEVLRAVHQLLFREPRGPPGVVLYRHVRLQASDAGERPAAATMSLILHLRDNPLLAPVNVLRQVPRRRRRAAGRAPCRRAVLGRHEHMLLELIVAHVRKLVDPHLPSPPWSRIVPLDRGQGLREVRKAEALLGGGGVALPVLRLELLKPGGRVRAGGAERCQASQRQEQADGRRGGHRGLKTCGERRSAVRRGSSGLA